MPMRAALRLQRPIGYRKTRPAEEDAFNEYWQAVERNEAKDLKRNSSRKWDLRRSREQANPQPLSADPSSDEAIPADPPSFA